MHHLVSAAHYLSKDEGSLILADASWVTLSGLYPDLWEAYRQTLEILPVRF